MIGSSTVNNKIAGLLYLMLGSFMIGCGITIMLFSWINYNKHYKIIY